MENWAIFICLLSICPAGLSLKCMPRAYDGEYDIVCVCNATYCDDLMGVPPLANGEALVIQSSKSGMRFEREVVRFTRTKYELSDPPSVSIDASQLQQEILGFGGAFTDAAGINIASLSPKAQENLLNSYYSKTGIEYSIGRVPIASNDFSTRVYSYDDSFGDFEMKKFALAPEDLKYKIPYIQKALELSKGQMKLFSTPWGAPGWMKKSGEMIGPGPLLANPRIREAYAKYFVRFFEEYEKHNISFWGTSSQNQPMMGIMPLYQIQSVYFTAKAQREFIKNYLGPALKNNSLTKNIKLIALDEESALLPTWASEMYSDEYVWSTISGFGIHWYTDIITPTAVLTLTHYLYPEKFILNTEACARIFPGRAGPMLGFWSRAETYADSIISDLNNWVGGWVDFNICLNEDGGPSWAGITVDSPIIVNKHLDEFYKQPMFYAMGHFSKFIRPGAVRIKSKTSDEAWVLKTVATVLNGQRVLVILNSSPMELTDLDIGEASDPSRVIYIDIPPHSLTTIVWNEEDS